jgi:5-bromo-4-chloroindolyl phosphate hydrolysis protein
MKKDTWIPVILPLLAALVFFAAAIVLFKWNLVIAAALALASYIGLNLICTPIFTRAWINNGGIKNSEEILALLEEGEKDLVSIKKITDAAKDHAIKTKAQHVYREGGKIIEYIKKNPARAVMARRFFNYYLDKANEILTKYHNLISAGIETESLLSLKEKTLSAMESILRGMTVQFSRLISSEVIDIEADVKLLESTIKMEGS